MELNEQHEVIGEQITPIQAIKALFQKKYALNAILTIILLMVLGGTIFLGNVFYKQIQMNSVQDQAIREIVAYLNKATAASQPAK